VLYNIAVSIRSQLERITKFNANVDTILPTELVSERVSDCSLAPCGIFFGYIMVRTVTIDDMMKMSALY
jgi:hypothetical protein